MGLSLIKSKVYSEFTALSFNYHQVPSNSLAVWYEYVSLLLVAKSFDAAHSVHPSAACDVLLYFVQRVQYTTSYGYFLSFVEAAGRPNFKAGRPTVS